MSILGSDWRETSDGGTSGEEAAASSELPPGAASSPARADARRCAPRPAGDQIISGSRPSRFASGAMVSPCAMIEKSTTI